MSSIYPVMLAGGSGTRLWPLSRKFYPKQFAKITSGTTLFQSSALRLMSSETITLEPHITLTNSEYRFIVTEQLNEVGINPGPILIEPESKNTAAAILTASLFAHSNNKDAILLVAPTDHIVPETDEFHSAVLTGLPHVLSGKIVTFGIKPTRSETGYGYLEVEDAAIDEFGTSNLKKFIEKPSKNKLKQMFNSGNILWNAGIFLFRAKDMINAFRDFAPETFEYVEEAVLNASPDLGFLRLAAEPWSMLQNISIDYAIMEKAKNLVAVPYNSDWSDLGGWDAVWMQGRHDPSGNLTSASAHAIDCSNSLLRSESSNQQIVGLGLDNIIAIATTDAVLVADKNRAQEVKNVVEILKERKVSQAEISSKEHRPWGWFESLALGDIFQVKRIIVKPEASLSLQSHSYRSEHWIVVEGTAKVTINDDIRLIFEGQSVYVPLGAKHRLENPKNLPLLLIEVQIGSYLGEDDIIRYDDIYSRV